MNVLVACEESQRVTIEFRKLGHEAYSCDLLDCSGNHPEWHIKKDVTLLLNGNCIFYTVDGVEHKIPGKWDMIIAFPPCTYLTLAGNRWFNCEKYGDKAIQRMLDRKKAIKFFMTIAKADCDRIAIENPVGIMSTEWRKPDQIIQPFEFGDAYEKKTCLWLKGLKKLVPTDIVEIPDRIKFKSGKSMAKWFVDTWNLPKEQRALVRSKTFPGIAKAMATQWGIGNGVFKGSLKSQCFDTDDLQPNKTIIAKIEDINYCPNQNTCCAVSPYVHCDYNYKSEACNKEHKNFIHDCEQVHKHLKAINNPEWHNVSLATLANIDNDMLDEKRRNYIFLYHLIKDFRKYAFEIKREGVYFDLASNVLINIRKLYFDNVISHNAYEYAVRHVQVVNVEKGYYSSKREKTFGFKESRRYNAVLR